VRIRQWLEINKMKEYTAEVLNVPAQAGVAGKSWTAILADLIKVRLTALVLMTMMAGFYLGWRGAPDFALMFNTLAATALLASGASALNQLLEREYDAQMRRTQDRPLPSGRLQATTVMLLGGVFSAAGLVYLALAVNLVTCVIGALTLAGYLFIYTPLKRITWLNTTVGAVPGALPALMGWTAARGEINAAGWALFAIVAFWQIPHFMAIAWMYREDYARAGFKMLPVVEPDGGRTGEQSVSYTVALVVAGVTPFLLKLAGPVYLAGAIILGLGYLGCAIRFSRERTLKRARVLFLASIVYLPLLLGLMVWDKAN
jgi:protoheme IX farnesyltransferase